MAIQFANYGIERVLSKDHYAMYELLVEVLTYNRLYARISDLRTETKVSLEAAIEHIYADVETWR